MSRKEKAQRRAAAEQNSAPKIVEVIQQEQKAEDLLLELGMGRGVKTYQMGQCRIFLAPPHSGRGYHMSIACPKRYPTMGEVLAAWYELVPGAAGILPALLLPSQAEFSADNVFAYHVYEIPGNAVNTVHVPQAQPKRPETPGILRLKDAR